MALQLDDKGICERCRRMVSLAELNSKGFCGACAIPEKIVPELALAASLDMDAIVRDVVEAGLIKDLGRGIGVGLKPKEKAAWDRLKDLKNAVKALPDFDRPVRAADYLKERCLAAVKDAQHVISTGGTPKTRPVEARTNSVIGYFKDFLSPLRDIGYAHDPQLRASLAAVRTALPSALDAIRALAA